MQLSLQVQTVSNVDEPVLVGQSVPLAETQDRSMSLEALLLRDPKLLSNIFDAMEFGSTKKHLLWAALTCTMFRDPALNTLWRSLDSLLPLLKVLPSFRLVNGIYVRKNPVQPFILSDPFEDLPRGVPKP